MKLATTGDVDTAAGHRGTNQLPADLPVLRRADDAARRRRRLDLATTGIGATALAARWNSPVLVDVNEQTLTALLEHPDLLETLEQIEDFRNLANMAHQVVTSTKKLKKASARRAGNSTTDEKKEKKETNSARRRSARSCRSSSPRSLSSCT